MTSASTCAACNGSDAHVELDGDRLHGSYGSERFDMELLFWLAPAEMRPQGQALCDQCVDRHVSQGDLEPAWNIAKSDGYNMSPKGMEAVFFAAARRIDDTIRPLKPTDVAPGAPVDHAASKQIEKLRDLLSGDPTARGHLFPKRRRPDSRDAQRFGELHAAVAHSLGFDPSTEDLAAGAATWSDRFSAYTAVLDMLSKSDLDPDGNDVDLF